MGRGSCRRRRGSAQGRVTELPREGWGWVGCTLGCPHSRFGAWVGVGAAPLFFHPQLPSRHPFAPGPPRLPVLLDPGEQRSHEGVPDYPGHGSATRSHRVRGHASRPRQGRGQGAEGRGQDPQGRRWCLCVVVGDWLEMGQGNLGGKQGYFLLCASGPSAPSW